MTTKDNERSHILNAIYKATKDLFAYFAKKQHYNITDIADGMFSKSVYFEASGTTYIFTIDDIILDITYDIEPGFIAQWHDDNVRIMVEDESKTNWQIISSLTHTGGYKPPFTYIEYLYLHKKVTKL